jgi:transposase
VFIWDNLTAHHSAYVHNTVTGCVGPSNFSIVPRPPYHPKYGPIGDGKDSVEEGGGLGYEPPRA